MLLVLGHDHTPHRDARQRRAGWRTPRRRRGGRRRLLVVSFFSVGRIRRSEADLVIVDTSRTIAAHSIPDRADGAPRACGRRVRGNFDRCGRGAHRDGNVSVLCAHLVREAFFLTSNAWEIKIIVPTFFVFILSSIFSFARADLVLSTSKASPETFLERSSAHRSVGAVLGGRKEKNLSQEASGLSPISSLKARNEGWERNTNLCGFQFTGSCIQILISTRLLYV